VRENVVGDSYVYAYAPLECPMAGLLRGGRSAGKVLVVSARMALILYSYTDKRPDRDPVIYEFAQWSDLKKDAKLLDFVASVQPDIVMCDIGYDPDLYFPESVMKFAKFVEEEVVEKIWQLKFVNIFEMMEGGLIFSGSDLLLKSFLYVTPKLGGLLKQSTKDLADGVRDCSLSAILCTDFALGKRCTKYYSCKKRHLPVCMQMVENGFCTKDRSVCSYEHLDDIEEKERQGLLADAKARKLEGKWVDTTVQYFL
jgi:hypothetical protein